MRHGRGAHARRNDIRSSLTAMLRYHSVRWAAVGAVALALALATVGAGTGYLYANEGTDATTYTAEADVTGADGAEATATVTVEVPDGAFEDEVELRVQAVDTDDAASALDDAGVAYDGMVPLDISFVDENGDEVEPAEPVTVTIELPSSVMGDDVDASTIAVSHLVEDEDGAVSDVETVADAGDEAEGTVTLDGASSLSSDTEVDESSTVAAEFTVESFSTFTISWSSGNGWNTTTYFTVTVYYVDEDDNEIEGTQTNSVSVNSVSNSGETYTFSDYAGTISGHTYSGATYNGSTVTSMTFSQSSNWGQTTRTLTFYNGDNAVATLNYSNRTQTATVYLVYEESDFSIEDNVSSSGEYTVVYSGAGGSIGDYTFVWYRDDGNSTSDTIYPTSNDDWAEVTRTRVSGSMYNLTEDGTALNVALDAELANASGSQRFWYKVEVYDSDGEPVATLYQKSMYYYELQNGSFEKPALSSVGQSNGLTDANEEVIWKTTDTQSLIEIIRPGYGTSGNSGGTLTTHGVTRAPDGNQIAELNAESEGTLYQDVLTVPGSTLNWQLQHRVRNYAGGTNWYSGYDTMYVVIMSEAAAANITSQSQVNAIIDAAGFDQDYYYTDLTNGTPEEKTVESGDYAGTVVWRITDYISGSSSLSNTGWTRYMDSYTVPDGQYLTRFFFASGATSYDNNQNATESLKYTVGNLLDDVAFTTDILDPDEGSATLSVTKVVDGLNSMSDEDWKNYSVTFTVTDSDNGTELGTITISNFTANSDGTYSGTGSLTIKLDTNETSKTVTITETDPTVNGYTVTTTVSGSATADSSNSLKATATLNDGMTTSVTYTNTYTYTSSGVDLQIFKYWDADEDGSYDDNEDALSGAKFVLYKDANTSGSEFDSEVDTTKVGSAETGDGGLATIEDISDGTYWLVETVAPSGYSLAEPVQVVVEGGAVTVNGANATYDAESGAYLIRIGDTKIASLPQTGGSLTPAMFAAGAAVVAVAGWTLAAGRRRAR